MTEQEFVDAVGTAYANIKDSTKATVLHMVVVAQYDEGGEAYISHLGNMHFDDVNKTINEYARSLSNEERHLC